MRYLKDKLVLTTLVALTIYGLVVALAILPLAHNVETTGETIAFQRQELAAAEALLSGTTGRNDTAHIDAVSATVAALDGVFIESTAALEFINSIEGLARNRSVTETMTLSEFGEIAPGSSKPVSVQVTATGSFGNVLLFLSDLEALRPMVKINPLSLIASTNLGTITAAANATTYWKASQ